MKRLRIIMILFLVLTSNEVYAQFPFFHYFQDSLLPGDRISGSFDSIDCKIAEYQSTLPSRWRPSTDLFDLENLSTPRLTPSLTRFSAIAQVGFQYALGSNNTQRAQITYTQALTETSFLQMDYVRRSGNGAIRNSIYESNYLDLQYLLKKRNYSSVVKVLFEGSDQSLSGGTVNDSIDPNFELIFTEVENPAAKVVRRNFNLNWENYLSFTGDSVLKTGIFLSPHFNVRNRRFTETGNFDTLYGNYNYDSASTYDHWERTEVGVTAGYFFHSQYFSLNGGFKTSYWDFDNLGRHGDTLETAITGNVLLSIRENIGLKGDLYYNLSGAFGEKALNLNAYYNGRVLQANAGLSFSQRFPQNFQRQLRGNQYDYSWDNKQLVTSTKFRASLSYANKIAPLTADFGVSNYSNFPFFINSTWRQDTLTNLSFTHFSIRADLRLKKVFFQPSVRFQGSNFNFLPSVQAFARLGFEGYLFKAKKLKAAIGIEGGYITAFNLLDYQPFMDTYILPVNGTRSFEAMPKLHFFGQFELGFLRWFIRVENIEQTLLTTQNYEALGYPVVPLQFRLGISWDIFN